MYDFTQLCLLVDLPSRKVRYYIQKGLVNRPDGAKKTASYSNVHVEQLTAIKHWQSLGLSLEKIKALLDAPTTDKFVEQPKTPGQIDTISRIYLAKGVYLEVNRLEAGLSSASLRQLSKQTIEYLQVLTKDEHE